MRPLAPVVAFAVLAAALAPAGARPRVRPTASPAPTATPAPPTAAPLSRAERLERLRGRLDDIARTAPGPLGVAIVDLDSKGVISRRGTSPLPVAGVATLAIAFAAYRLADQHRLDLDERILVGRADLRPGSELARRHPHGGVTLATWELVRAMLASGDPTARDLVLRRVGGPAGVDGILDRLGLAGVRLEGGATATPDTAAALLAGVAENRFLLLDAITELFGALTADDRGAERLRAGLPDDVRLAHETAVEPGAGGGTRAVDDVGVLTFPDGRRVIVAALLAHARGDDHVRDAPFAELARAIDAAFR